MKLRVTIDPGWFHGVRVVEVDLDPTDYEGYDLTNPDDQESALFEIAQDLFNNEVSWGYEVIQDD